MFYLDSHWLDINGVTQENIWPDKEFLMTLFMMKPFRAYFLIDKNKILCSKYNDVL